MLVSKISIIQGVIFLNPYDAAHKLAKALSKSSEFTELKKAKDELEKDSSAKKMLSDFRKKQLEVQTLKLTGKPVEEATKELKNLFNIISYNDDIINFLNAEQRFATLMIDIQNIIAKAVGLEFDFEDDKNQNDNDD